MKRAKKNNKGFSLVELIVVVLIIGVIGVALAPQIMKWVDTSKKNTDINNAGVIQSAVQTALAEWQSEGGSLDKFSATGTTVYVKDKKIQDTTFEGTGFEVGTDGATLQAYINQVIAANDFPEAKYQKLDATGNDFSITIYKSGKVEVKCKASEAATGSGGTPSV